MYELFLLGKLLARPWYGYEFQEALSGFFGSQRRVSWGTIYPLFQRLQRDGLIRPVSSPRSGDRRDKQVYAITAAGKKRFFELMLTERSHDSDFRETFRIKLGHFSRVSLETRKQIVSSYRKRLNGIREHTVHTYGVVKQLAGMEDDERKMILRAIRHERSLVEAETTWMEKELKEYL